ncbi:uncharacterized protein LOC125418850 [Ziziphus jujuba]|uniref:Uncharacterized protein LOC125418850 n=1 Tax=Ziziphus jujuba TaxID=326968 RepID=A0ABM3I2W1_ZIZJJ|nr:uncharacterized protein LOC125418850 [Ziziphus jujuba]
MFAKSSSSTIQATIRTLMYSRMIGGNVRDHCLMMMGHFSCTVVMGAKLDEEVQNDIILESLPNSVNKFKLNYDMLNMKLSPIDIMHQLESVEKTLVKLVGAYHVEGSYKPKGQPKCGKKNKK